MMIERASVFNPASPPARVLVFAPTPRGGLAEHVHYQARELARRGFAVTVLCHPDFAKSDPAYRREARLRSAQGTGPAACVARAALRIADYYGLAAAILRERPDWVLLEANSEYLSPTWFLPHWLLRRRGIIYVANFHDPVRKRRFGPAWWHALTVRLAYAPLAGGLIHAEAPAGAYLPSRLVMREAPFGPFADLAGQAPSFDLRARLGIPRDAFVLLSFGHVADRKNLDLVIAALAGHPKVHLVVAGQPASRSERPIAVYAGLANEAGVAERVHFVEAFIPDAEVPAYFAAADAVALTYAREFVSQSGVLQIAALFDKPLLASGGAGPLPTTVREYGLGVVVEPDSAQAIGEGLERLIAEPRDLSANFARYRASTSWEVNIDRLLEVVAAVKASRSA